MAGSHRGSFSGTRVSRLDVTFGSSVRLSPISSQARRRTITVDSARGQEWKILADPTMGDPDRITFRCGWTDDLGEHEEEMIYIVFARPKDVSASCSPPEPHAS